MWPSTQTVSITAGTGDYSYSGLVSGHGSGSLSGLSASNASDPSYLFTITDSGYELDVLIGYVHVTVDKTFPTSLGDIVAHLNIDGLFAAYTVFQTGNNSSLGVALGLLSSDAISPTDTSWSAPTGAQQPALSPVGSQGAISANMTTAAVASQSAIVSQPAVIDALAAQLFPDLSLPF